MLDALRREQEIALQLTEYEGMTQKELAERLGISVSGAEVQGAAGPARLKALLLDCCHLELDRRGNVVNYYDRDLLPCRSTQPPATVGSPPTEAQAQNGANENI